MTSLDELEARLDHQLRRALVEVMRRLETPAERAPTSSERREVAAAVTSLEPADAPRRRRAWIATAAAGLLVAGSGAWWLAISRHDASTNTASAPPASSLRRCRR